MPVPGYLVEASKKFLDLVYDKDQAYPQIDWLHLQVHKGLHYTAVYEAVVDIGQTVDVLLLTPNQADFSWHMVSSVVTTNGGEFILQEGVTYSANGTPLLVNNNNRQSPNTTSVAVLHTPTITDIGLQLDQIHFPTGKANAELGASGSDRHEWILKQNEAYLLRFTADANATRVSLSVQFYEHDHSYI